MFNFVRNQGRFLTEEELSKGIWPDTFVEEVNLAVNISTLRKARRRAPKAITIPIRCLDAASEVCGLRQLVLACQSELSGETRQTTWR
jgi:hypothetical protein